MDKLTEIFKANYSEEKNNLESVLLLLRNAGATQIQSVKILRYELGIPLQEADSQIINSVVWKDFRNSNQELRNTFFDKLD